MENILIVDDNQDLCILLADTLKEAGYGVQALSYGKQALKAAVENPPDVILLDIHLPDIDGMKVLEKLKKLDSKLTVVMLTAYGHIKDAVEAIKAGAFDYITKPFEKEALLLSIKRALENRKMNLEVNYLRQELAKKSEAGGIIGDSSAIQQIVKKVKVVAPTNMTVVIYGESGVGKELFADLIHRESARKGKPYIPIDCGAIPENLVESELFGHEKGAFTGAFETKQGKFEQAQGGTLFLDEVTNLPEAAQAKLLRVLEERKIWHVGGKSAFEIDVRIVAATNVDMANAVKLHKFRADLFHRLNEFNIVVPPLRERQDDIVAIAKHFIVKSNQELNKQVKGFSTEALKILLLYSWPGNVREMRNAVRMSVLSAEGELIAPGDLPRNITERQEEEIPPLNKPVSNEIVSMEKELSNFEMQLINRALAITGGNKVKAAEALQIDRKALYRKMQRLGLS